MVIVNGEIGIMALAPLKLFVETQSRRLKSSATNPQDFTLPYFVQFERILIYLQFLSPKTPFIQSDPYDILDADGFSPAITISGGTGLPAGTAGGTVIAETSGIDWTWDSANQRFTGTLDLTPDAVATFLGGEAKKTTTIEIELADSTNHRAKYIQQELVLKAAVRELLTVAPDPANVYRTANESDALYARFVNDAGKTITFTSIDSTATREIGVDNDANPIDNSSDS